MITTSGPDLEGSSHEKDMWLCTILMGSYADQVGHSENSIKGFVDDWETLIQPVIENGEVHANADMNWAAFSLLFFYLESEGVRLPVCSKPWIAAIRLFLAISGKECPARLHAHKPPFWSNQIGGDYPPDLSYFEAGEVQRLGDFLHRTVDELDGLSLSRLRTRILQGELPRFFTQCGFVNKICDSIVTWESPGTIGYDSDDLQMILLNVLRGSGKYSDEDLALSFSRARTSANSTQFDILVRTITSTKGEQGYGVSIEECSGLFYRPRVRGEFGGLDPFGEFPILYPVFFIHQASFPGRLPEPPWVPRADALMKPPDPLKLWVAQNWVNPRCPLWLMTVPAIEEILKALGLVEVSGDHQSVIRQAGRVMTSLLKNGKRQKDLPVKSVSISGGIGGYSASFSVSDDMISHLPRQPLSGHFSSCIR